ncbi:hypothetical protein [Amycolatopsis keratiniphila]|uniref:Uncharacterized protein n=1 Tax=Amycolatopsis keratiniphila TaxID=129921 RepID=R4T2T3_9PSEU|nr:hypothetical protein [Amycolatopsis keratiniphila]AGM06741.1 hypothetical protein AORI_4156 [Amycolatopsis keratiniphila]
MTKSYDRRAFALSYLAAQPEYSHGFSDDDSEYNDALRAYRERLFKGLESLFGLELTWDGVSDRTDGSVLFVLFSSAARNHLGVEASGFLEGGLLVKALERAGQDGPVLASMSRSIDLRDRLWASYVDTMELVLGILLGERADDVFTSADLRAVGVDDTEPRER